MDEPLNLLSLDGGGIRGVSMLVILHEIMSRIKSDKKLSEIPKPCEYFHLIGGTSTGGLIALMLGRLQMSTRDALRTYNKLAEMIFCKGNQKSTFKDGTFKATTLEKEIQKLVTERELGEYMEFEDKDSNHAKTFVCAIPAMNMDRPRLFRSYEVRENASANCKIWEAARATTAAPTFFKRIQITHDAGAKEDFLDGGMRYNNPTRLLLDEAYAKFGGKAKLGCLISLGTGQRGTVGLAQPDSFQKVLPTKLIDVLKSNATDCEKTAEEIARQFGRIGNRYFRLSVSHDVGNISLQEWKKTDEVQTHTKAYMEKFAVNSSVNDVVSILCKEDASNDPGPSLQSICQVDPSPSVSAEEQKTPIKYQTPSTALFTGRQDFLTKLENYFTARGPGEYQRREFLLHGMGGAGKTQIANKFAELHRTRRVSWQVSILTQLMNLRRYERVFWLDATNKDTIEQSYKIIAMQIGKQGDGKYSLDEARQELGNYQNHWLLLFDAADDLEELSELIPLGIHGDIIYTSRNPMFWRLPTSQILEVSKMDLGESRELLMKSARLNASAPEHQQHASAIVTKLGCLALAVDQAGAYIANGECYLDEYLDDFSTRHQDLLRNNAYSKASGIDQAVYATWDLSYTAIAKKATSANILVATGSHAALQLLQILPFFHNEGVMEETFKLATENRESNSKIDDESKDESNDQLQIGCDTSRSTGNDDKLYTTLLTLDQDGTWDHRNFRRGIQTLLSFSLIARQSSPRHLNMHPLVHLWAFDRMTKDEKARSGKATGEILAQSISFGNRSEDYAYRRDLLPHVTAHQRQSQSSSFPLDADSLERVALVFEEAGRWNKVEELTMQVLNFRRKVLGPKHPKTVVAEADLASNYMEQGRWKEAEKIGLQVLEARKRMLGPEHPDTLITIGNLSSTYQYQGRWKEAEELGLQASEAHTRLLGPKHPGTLTSLNNLAAIYCGQERWKDAEEIEYQVLNNRKTMLGLVHPDTLSSMNNLASTYWHQERLDEARNLEYEALDIRKRVLGSDHPHTLLAMNNLARTLHAQGSSMAAISLMRDCYELQKHTIGPTHPDTQSSLRWLDAWENKADGGHDSVDDSSSCPSTSKSEIDGNDSSAESSKS